MKSFGVPESISHYRILKKLGAGGMGEVYLAEDTRLNRKVAVKFLPSELVSDEGAKKRLLREARSAIDLDNCRREHQSARTVSLQGEELAGGDTIPTAISETRRPRLFLSRRALISYAMLVLALGLALTYLLAFRRSATTERFSEIRSLAVLPLKDLSVGVLCRRHDRGTHCRTLQNRGAQGYFPNFGDAV